MRTIYSLNPSWAFSKEAGQVPASLPMDWEQVNLPHTWNAQDGMDGGNDYHRGTCYYAKSLKRADLPQADKYFLEFRGANSSADVYVDGKKLAHHDGGYSTWRVDLTSALGEESLLAVLVDNAPKEDG